MLEENSQSALQPNCTFICMDEHHTHILYAVDNYITLCSNESIWKGLYELETHTIVRIHEDILMQEIGEQPSWRSNMDKSKI